MIISRPSLIESNQSLTDLKWWHLKDNFTTHLRVNGHCPMKKCCIYKRYKFKGNLRCRWNWMMQPIIQPANKTGPQPKITNLFFICLLMSPEQMEPTTTVIKIDQSVVTKVSSSWVTDRWVVVKRVKSEQRRLNNQNLMTYKALYHRFNFIS